MIIIYVLSALTIAGWPFAAFMSVFAFDAPGSAQDPTVWNTVGLVLAYPLLPLVGVPASFFLYRGSRKVLSYVLTAIGAVPLAIFIFFLISLMVMNVMFALRGEF
jgi:hypothetical protein